MVPAKSRIRAASQRKGKGKTVCLESGSTSVQRLLGVSQDSGRLLGLDRDGLVRAGCPPRNRGGVLYAVQVR